jgi:nicotinamide-nucleotide amidase
MVWFAWSLEGRRASSEVMQFQGDRDAVRRQTVVHALRGLQELLGE